MARWIVCIAESLPHSSRSLHRLCECFDAWISGRRWVAGHARLAPAGRSKQSGDCLRAAPCGEQFAELAFAMTFAGRF